jgi:pyruvate/2-oxoglutarate dehydrogenase complex dihydrolipoamide acyltransferase (E2) component
VSASRAALVEQPVVNGYIDDETQEIVYRNYVDISGTMLMPTAQFCII